MNATELHALVNLARIVVGAAFLVLFFRPSRRPWIRPSVSIIWGALILIAETMRPDWWSALSGGMAARFIAIGITDLAVVYSITIRRRVTS